VNLNIASKVFFRYLKLKIEKCSANINENS